MSEISGLPAGVEQFIRQRQHDVEPDRTRICFHESDSERAECSRCDRGLLPVQPMSNLPEWSRFHQSWTSGQSHPRDPMDCPECRKAMWTGRGGSSATKTEK